MNKHLRRGAVALAIVLACVAGQVAPAAAWTVQDGTITGGTVTLINSTGTATDTIPLGGTGATGTGCASSIGSHIIISDWSISKYSTISRFKLNTTWYVVDSTKTGTGTAGTVTSVTTTSATLNSSGLTLAASIYTATDQSDTGTSCAHGTTRTCRFANVALSIQGTYSGDWNSPAASNTASLTGTGTLGTTTPPCNAPFTTYNAGTITITGLTAHVTSVT